MTNKRIRSTINRLRQQRRKRAVVRNVINLNSKLWRHIKRRCCMGRFLGRPWHWKGYVLGPIFRPYGTKEVKFIFLKKACGRNVEDLINTVFTEWNSTKLKRKHNLNVLYQICVFQADRKNKMEVPASDLLRHFLLLLWNRWTDFNEFWQEV